VKIHVDLSNLRICRESGQWIQCKHSIIREYLPAFLRTTSSAFDRAYVDLYSGPGCNVIKGTGERRLGSPVIALTVASQLAGSIDLKYPARPLLQFFFNDLDPEHVEQLRSIANLHFPDAVINFSANDANKEIFNILSKLHSKTPTFFVLDPEGSELYWSTIKAIAKKERADVLINLPLGGLKRLMGRGDEISHNHVSRVFGTDDWKPIAKRARGRISDRELLDLYLSRLEGLGFQVASSGSFSLERLATNTKNVPLYYLIFAAKGPKTALALKIARSIFSRDCSGQRFLF